MENFHYATLQIPVCLASVCGSIFPTGGHVPFSVFFCFWLGYREVSLNRGTSESSILLGFSSINHIFWGTSIYGNPTWSNSTTEHEIWLSLKMGNLSQDVAIKQKRTLFSESSACGVHNLFMQESLINRTIAQLVVINSCFPCLQWCYNLWISLKISKISKTVWGTNYKHPLYSVTWLLLCLFLDGLHPKNRQEQAKSWGQKDSQQLRMCIIEGI